MTTPYTYVLTHIPSGKKYYGMRCRKNCHPDEFWVKYFTSSKIVKRLIQQDGIYSFDFEIRKTFKTKIEAIVWEHKVLRRLKVHTDVNWLNQCNGNEIFPMTFGRLGKTTSEEHKKKIGDAQRGSKNHMYGKTHTPEAREKIRAAHLGRKASKETRTKMSEYRKKHHTGFVIGGEKTEKHRESIRKSRIGKKHSEESKRKMSQAQKGRTLSEETKRRMTESQKRRWEERKNKQSMVITRTNCVSPGV